MPTQYELAKQTPEYKEILSLGWADTTGPRAVGSFYFRHPRGPRVYYLTRGGQIRTMPLGIRGKRGDPKIRALENWNGTESDYRRGFRALLNSIKGRLGYEEALPIVMAHKGILFRELFEESESTARAALVLADESASLRKRLIVVANYLFREFG